MGTPSSGVCVFMTRRNGWASRSPQTTSLCWTFQSIQGERAPRLAGRSGAWWTRRRQIICIQVVPDLERVLITMSPWRKEKPHQRALSSSGEV